MITKINLKWITELNIRLETIKLLEKNIGRKLFDINHENIFLDLSPKAKETKVKVKLCLLVKLKSFCTAKEIINNNKKKG